MSKTDESDDSVEESQRPLQVRLPGFIIDEKIGLGDVVKRATTYVGIKPCGGCEKRAATLNRWVNFTNGQQK